MTAPRSPGSSASSDRDQLVSAAHGLVRLLQGELLATAADWTDAGA